MPGQGNLTATGTVQIIVQTLNAEEASQKLNQISQQLQKTGAAATRTGRSFMRGILGIFYMRQALRSVANAMKEFGAGNDITAAKMKTLTSAVSDSVLGFMVMQRMLPGVAGLIAGTGMAATRAVTAIINWRKNMLDAASGVISKFTTAKSTLEKFAESTSDLERYALYMKMVKNYGEETAQALLKMKDAGNMEELIKSSEDFAKAIYESLKSQKLGREALEETKNIIEITQKSLAGERGGLTGAVEKFTIAEYNTVKAIKLVNQWLYGQTEAINKAKRYIEIYYTNLQNYYEKIYGVKPQRLSDFQAQKEEEAREYERYIEDKRQAEEKFTQELLKLRGQDFEAFKRDLQEKIKEYSKYIDDKKALEEYYNLSIKQYLEEQERERKATINKIVQADVEAIRQANEEKKRQEEEFRREREREQKEWENFYMKALGKETELFVKQQVEQLQAFQHYKIAKEQLAEAMYQTFKKYAEDYYSSELKQIEAMKEMLGLVQKSDLDILMEKVQNFPQFVENIKLAYTTLARINLSPLEQQILQILQEHDEWIKKTGDVELATRITNAELELLYKDYVKQKEEEQQKILDTEQRLQDRIKELTMDSYDYQIEKLEEQAQKYREMGLSELTVEKWLYFEKRKLWEQEVEAYKEKEERKREILRAASESYEKYMLKVQGATEKLRVYGYFQSVESLIQQIWTSGAEDRVEKIKNIIASFPEYVKQSLGLAGEEFAEQWANYTNIVAKFQQRLQDFFSTLQKGIEIPPELAEKEPKEPDWSELSDQIKDVTANTNEFWQIVAQVMEEWNNVKTKVSEVANATKEELINAVLKAEKTIRKKIQDLIAYMQSLYKTWYQTGYTSGLEYGKGFFLGVKEWVGRIAGIIHDYIGFHSPPKKGPLSDADQYGYRFMKMFIQSMAKLLHPFQQLLGYFFKPMTEEQYFNKMFMRMWNIMKSVKMPYPYTGFWSETAKEWAEKEGAGYFPKPDWLDYLKGFPTREEAVRWYHVALKRREYRINQFLTRYFGSPTITMAEIMKTFVQRYAKDILSDEYFKNFVKSNTGLLLQSFKHPLAMRAIEGSLRQAEKQGIWKFLNEWLESSEANRKTYEHLMSLKEKYQEKYNKYMEEYLKWAGMWGEKAEQIAKNFLKSAKEAQYDIASVNLTLFKILKSYVEETHPEYFEIWKKRKEILTKPYALLGILETFIKYKGWQPWMAEAITPQTLLTLLSPQNPVLTMKERKDLAIEWLKENLTKTTAGFWKISGDNPWIREIKKRWEYMHPEREFDPYRAYRDYIVAALIQQFGMTPQRLIEEVGKENIKKAFGIDYEEYMKRIQKYILQPGEYDTTGKGSGRGAVSSATVVMTFNLFTGQQIELDTLKAQITDGVLQLLYALGFS